MSKLRCIPKHKLAACWNENGFTLLEVMFSLTILSIIVFFMTPIFQTILTNSVSQSALQGMEWEVFSAQIKKEIRMSSKAEVITGRLILTKDGETITYEKYGNFLRRRVNSQGHEILLQNVASYSFAILPNRVKVTVTDIKGKNYSVMVYAMIDWGNAP